MPECSGYPLVVGRTVWLIGASILAGSPRPLEGGVEDGRGACFEDRGGAAVHEEAFLTASEVVAERGGDGMKRGAVGRDDLLGEDDRVVGVEGQNGAEIAGLERRQRRADDGGVGGICG